MPRPLISEAAVHDAVSAGKTELVIPPNAIITALALDAAKAKGIRFVHEDAATVGLSTPSKPATTAPPKTLALGCDHAGFAYKADLMKYAEFLGWAIVDVGTNSERSVDYPDFAFAVARHVQRGTARFGLMIDGVGVGSAMVANKVPGIRAALCPDVFSAYNARAHNDANVLALGSRTMGIEACKRILSEFLTTAFEGGRHERRVAKISDVEARFLPGS